MRPLLCILIGILIPLRAGAGETDFSGLKEVLTAELAETHAPGAVFAVIRGDRIVFSAASGTANVEQSVPMRTDMLFQIGSLTKLFTAAAGVVLFEQQNLDIQAPIASFVKGLPDPVSRLTLHQLLTHTAGIRDIPAEYGPHGENALSEYVRSWDSEMLLIDPGRAFSYSNAGYALAGYVMQEIAKKPYTSLMQELLFDPLGMHQTTFKPTTAMTYPLAAGHRWEGGKFSIVRPVADDARFWPAGYIFTNLEDFSRFVIAFLNDGMIEGARALSPTAIRKVASPHVDVTVDDLFRDSHYGYGLFTHRYRGLHLLEHSGAMPGYNCELWMIPEQRIALLAFVNREGVRLVKTLNRALELAASPLQSETPAETTSLPISKSEMALLTGSYSNRWTVRLYERDHRLYLDQGGGECEVHRIGKRRYEFFAPHTTTSNVFEVLPGKQGRPEAILLYLWAFARHE